MIIVVTGGVDYEMTRADFNDLKMVMKLTGSQSIVTEPVGKVSNAVLLWALENQIPHLRGHPGSGGETKERHERRNAALLFLADRVMAFPGGEATADLVKKAQDRNIRVYNSRSREEALGAKTAPMPVERPQQSLGPKFGLGA